MTSFRFKQFTIEQDRTAMKVGTDGVLLGAWAEGGARILDIGTGTGLVALMMAQRFPHAEVTAIELDHAAATQAADNAARSPFASRVSVVEGDINIFCEERRTTNEERSVKSIVCNPPYYANTLPSRSASRDMARSAATLTLRQLMTVASRLLAHDGTLSVVLPADSRSEAEAEAALAGLCLERRTLVRTTARKPPKRVLLAFSPTPPPTLADETVTLQDGNDRSPWYARLTRDFYLPR